jgi:hypothetical protein
MSFDARKKAITWLEDHSLGWQDGDDLETMIELLTAAHRAGQREALESLSEWTTARDGWRELRDLYPYYAHGAPTEAAWAFGETDGEISRRLAELEKQT